MRTYNLRIRIRQWVSDELSLEGPRWVVYAVKGELGKGEDLPTGAMLNLKDMQKAGEEIYYLPVSDEEMKNVVNSVDQEIPEVE